MTDSERRPLGQQMLRGVGIFQALAALPTMIILGICAYEQLFYAYDLYYYFIADSMTALMAAGIVFIVYVQRKAVVTNFQTLLFETIKSILATGLWLWLILDSAFGPWKYRYVYHDGKDVERRVKRAALSSILLILLFYPPLVYAYIVWKGAAGHDFAVSGDDRTEDVDQTERTPLLQDDHFATN